MAITEAKQKAITSAIAKLHKQFGKESVMKYSDRPAIDIKTTPTGSLGMDIASGVHGYPKGRIIECFGAESSGKTTITLHAVAECQKAGGVAAFVDVEHALDPVYAANLGVDMDSLYLSQPDSAEEALEIVEELVSSGAFDIVIVDSVAALVPKAEIEGEMGDSHMGLQARLMSQALRKLTSVVSKSSCVLIFINQTRQKIGVVYGSDTTTTGGNALKFYASQRLEVKKIGVIKKDDGAIGHRVKATYVKNKVAPPLKFAEFDILFGQGINRLGELFDYAVTLMLIDKAGAWYSMDGEKIGQGRDNSLEYLREHPELVAKLERDVYKHYGLTNDEE